MKKLKKILQFNKRMVIITIGLIIAGCITTGIGFALVDYDIYQLNPDPAGELVSKEKAVPLADIDSIHLDVTHMNVSIESIEGNEFQLKYEEEKDQPTEITTTNKTLSIQSPKKFMIFQFNWMNIGYEEDANIKLQIPKDFVGELFVSTTYGTIHITSVKGIEEFHVDNAHGTIDVKNMEASKAAFTNSYGTTTVNDMKSMGEFSIDNAHDAIDINNIEASKVSFTNSYGTTTVSDVKCMGEFSIDNAHDAIDINNIEASKISIINSYGSTQANQLVSQSDVTLENQHDEIKLKDITARNFNGDLSYSGISIDTMKLENEFRILNAHGNVTLMNAQSKMSQMDLSYGDLVFENHLSNDITIDVEHGNVTGELTGKESEYHILSDVEHGKNNLANERNAGKSKKLDITLSYGDLDINFIGQ